MYQLPADSKLLSKNFIFGVATSSYQIEGGIDKDQREPSIWDTFCQQPGAVKGQENGAIACDHYHLWQQDVELIASLGVDAYRLSIAWPRIIRADGSTNQAGLAFYDQIIQALSDKGIKVSVTLYHWDLPQYLEDKGGWLNRETAYQFAHYADVVSQHFGNRIDSYATFNEPWCSAYLGYRFGIHAPGIKDQKSGYQAAHHLLLAHGLAMPILRRNAPQSQHGIVLNFTPNYAISEADDTAQQLAEDDNSHWFMQPIFEGSYPHSIQTLFAQDMPLVLDGDMDIIHVPIDFLGINFYTCNRVQADPQQGYQVVAANAEHVELTDMGWEVYPQALTDLLVGFKLRYTLPPIYITENGAATADEIVDGVVDDQQRMAYYQRHLLAVDEAIRQGVNVAGYFAWSLMDNFEWAEGYDKRFGLVYVDYQTQQRTLKNSALAFQSLLASR